MWLKMKEIIVARFFPLPPVRVLVTSPRLCWLIGKVKYLILVLCSRCVRSYDPVSDIQIPVLGCPFSSQVQSHKGEEKDTGWHWSGSRSEDRPHGKIEDTLHCHNHPPAPHLMTATVPPVYRLRQTKSIVHCQIMVSRYPKHLLRTRPFSQPC